MVTGTVIYVETTMDLDTCKTLILINNLISSLWAKALVNSLPQLAITSVISVWHYVYNDMYMFACNFYEDFIYEDIIY
jgi:hypothetical protein